jgi:leucyl/phenylalanyl-tRNA--protein transferase
MSIPVPQLPWLAPGAAFPESSLAWGASTPAPGLLAAGGRLDIPTLQLAYSRGIFPWFSEGQPVLWWSPDPRMVLQTTQFVLHPSLKKTIRKFARTPDCEIRFDSAFREVIQACARSPRQGQPGTWILPPMVEAYCELHRAGLAHSVESWIKGKLVGGLYCVALGGAVFGESMFSLANDASKIALAALVAFCRRHGIQQIDCQQNTAHLASLGAKEVHRAQFLAGLSLALQRPEPAWQFDPLFWALIMPSGSVNK